MKFYNFVMFLLTCFCIGIIIFGLTGCGGVDQHQYEQDKAENAYRKGLEDTNRPAPGYGGPITVTEEWADQWPSLRDSDK